MASSTENITVIVGVADFSLSPEHIPSTIAKCHSINMPSPSADFADEGELGRVFLCLFRDRNSWNDQNNSSLSGLS